MTTNSDDEIIEKVMKKYGMNYDVETSFDKSLKDAVTEALSMKDGEKDEKLIVHGKDWHAIGKQDRTDEILKILLEMEKERGSEHVRRDLVLRELRQKITAMSKAAGNEF